MKDSSRLIVSVVMITYNHEAYITQSIEGILTQKTSFDFELVIGEDHSSDDTRAICEKFSNQYPEIIKLMPELHKNLGVKGNFLRSYQSCKGKYIAICEGDDFWIDPYKLQKQIDFLEANPDYGLVHGDVNHLDQKTGKITKAYNKTNNLKIPSGDIFEFLMKPAHSIKTMTVCFRKELFEKYYLSNNQIMQSDWALTDISIWLMIAYHSKVHYFHEVFATYRLLSESMSRTKNPEKIHQFHQKIHAIRSYYAKNYKCSEDTRVILETYNYKLMLVDAYSINDVELAKTAMDKLKKDKIKISLKQKVMYFGVKYPLLKYLIDFAR